MGLRGRGPSLFEVWHGFSSRLGTPTKGPGPESGVLPDKQVQPQLSETVSGGVVGRQGREPRDRDVSHGGGVVPVSDLLSSLRRVYRRTDVSDGEKTEVQDSRVRESRGGEGLGRPEGAALEDEVCR